MGGGVLLKALDDQLQLADRLAACLSDRRDPDKVRHVVRDLLRHVDRVEVLDRAVVDTFRLGHRRVGHLAAERAHVHSETLSEARVLRQPVEALYVHATAPWAVDSPALELDVDPKLAGGEVAGVAGALVVPAAATVSTLRAARSFFGAVTPGPWRSGH